ncbi:phospholipid transport system transporter-binding protein [Alkalispirillum mobile]|uniref:Phospholipid transport system transporter-binding protein n=1 Tax=Alkalispirillum mobile TaxID=85925 RepID=A0A498BSE1_9GAMM|nr:STAS domain-containing protein [Alkalispirillum mobile]RLK46884.1 phospholipid transport system transporter-binding protein [Alkalispirillum mobile]
MSEAQLKPADGAGLFCLSGDLSFDTVPGLWAQAERLFRDAERVELDLGAVGRTDSAGLALLVALARRARQRGRSIRYTHFPEQLLAMARLSGLAGLLELDVGPA